MKTLYSVLGVSLFLSHAAWAQTNTSAAPILPPPPASALQPIPVPTTPAAVTSVTTTTTPTTHLDGSGQTSNAQSTQTTVTQSKTVPVTATSGPAGTPVTATPPAPAPTAQAMGNPAPVVAPSFPPANVMAQTTTTQTTGATPANGFTPPGATTTVTTTNQPVGAIPPVAAAPIALPGMPASESGLNPANAYGRNATNTIDPSLVGAGGANQGYDEAAYKEQLKQRLADLKVETREKAMTKATESTFPMQPDEIEDVIRQLRKTQAAIQKPIEVPPPTPRAVVHTMELDPGAQPPTIQMLNGNVTTLSILDATGQPWPIVDIAFGGAFDVKPPESGGHIIRISPLKEYARGNMSVRLQKLATPLTFTLDSGGTEVHYRFDARVPQLGPNAKSALINRGPTITAGEDQDMSTILVGAPPSSAEKLKVSGVDGRTSAYKLNGFTYVRTPHTLLSPTWESSVSSADGTNVYKLSEAPVLLLSDDGTMVRAQIQQSVVDPFGLPDDRKATAQPATLSGDRG